LLDSLNTIIGIYQEGSAEKAADALKAMLSSDAVVVRDGKECKIPATELVPGDIVKLGLGDRVPADMRMIRVSNLAAQEAALTGESVPIEKTVDPIKVDGGDPMKTPLGDRHNMCFSATLISSGTGTGVVVSTGDHTEIGTINALVNKVEKKKTNVLEQIDVIAKWLAIMILIAALCTWLAAYFVAKQDPIDALSTALVCAVAMIPEGLEAIVTMVSLLVKDLLYCLDCGWGNEHYQTCCAVRLLILSHTTPSFPQSFLHRLMLGLCPTWRRKMPLSVPFLPLRPWEV
jgi:magnesium-transporting ATPase (P-type)